MQPLKVSRRTRQHIHDKSFKTAMQSPEMVRQLLDAYLPEATQAMLDMDSIQQENDLFLDEGLHSHQTDALFRVKSRQQQEDVFILIEHKKAINHQCVDQIFRYMALIRDREYKRRGCKGKQSPVYVLVLYHGKRRVRRSLKFQSLANENLIMRQMMSDGPQLIDVRRVSSVPLKHRPLLRLWFVILRYAERINFSYVLRHMWPLVRSVLPKYTNFVWQMLQYVSSVTPNDAAVRTEIEHASNQVTVEQSGEYKMMTLAEGWLNEGYQKGIKEGREEGREEGLKTAEKRTHDAAKNLLAAGVSADVVAKAFALPLKAVKKLVS